MRNDIHLKFSRIISFGFAQTLRRINPTLKRAQKKLMMISGKPLLFLFLILFMQNLSAQTSVDKVLRKYRNDRGVASFNFAGDVGRYMQSNKDKLKSQIETCDVLIFDPKNNLEAKDLTTLKAIVKGNSYEELINIRDKRGTANIYVISKSDDVVKEVFAMVNAEGKNIYAVIRGNILLDELSKLNMFFEGGTNITKFLK
jgi:hypothetical protein